MAAPTAAETGESATQTTEAAILDAAWTACQRLAAGEEYEKLVYEAGTVFDASGSNPEDLSELAAVLYAPIVCHEFTDATLTAIGGIDGIDGLDALK